MIKSTLSLTSSVKSICILLGLFGLGFNIHAQNISSNVNFGETLELEVTNITSLELSGEGDVYLSSTENQINISGAVTISESIRLISETPLNFTNGGSLDVGYIDADIYMSGNWLINSTFSLAEHKELHLNNAVIELQESSIYVPNLITTGNTSIESNGGIILIEESVMLNSDLRLESSFDFIYVPEDAVVTNDADAPMHFFSRVINTCGTDPGQVPFTVDAQAVSDYNGENISCNGADDGVAQAFITGGVGPFTCQWFGGSGTPGPDCSYTGLGAGTYTVLVTDLGQSPPISCVDAVQLAEPSRVAIFSLNSTTPSCLELCDGSAFPVVFGGTGSYTFEYSNGNTNQVATDLCAGENTLSITDINNCVLDSVFFLDVDTLHLNLLLSDTLCFGDNSGLASVSPTGGSGDPYDILWNTTQTTEEISGLSPGTYSVEVTDSDGCTADSTFQIVGLPELITSINTVTNPTCPDDLNGSIDATVSGGLAPLNIQWFLDGDPFSTAVDLTGIGAGTYDLEVEDDFGCFGSEQVVITPQEIIEYDNVLTDVACFGDCSGSITTTMTQGLEPITFQWSDENGVFSNDPDVSDLCVGTYTLQVTDGGGCTSTTEFEVIALSQITLVETITDVTCNGGSDGSILFEVAGGIEPYSADVAFTNPTPSSVLVENLTGTDHTITISDASGCIITETYTVPEPDAIVITPTTTDPGCAFDNTGSISVAIAGGIEPYAIEWVELAVFDETEVTDLTAGTYTIIVTDANDCEQALEIELVDPIGMEVTETITNVLCNGDATGAISVFIQNGANPIDILWTGDDVIPTDQDQSNLTAGTYTLLLTDANGCEVTTEFEITEPEELVITETITQPLCEGELGEISVEITGGLEPYTIDWTVVVAPDQTIISDLEANTYQITVTDANGCELTESYEITAPNEIDVVLSLTQPTCLEPLGQAEIEITGGLEPYGIIWSGLAADDQTAVSDIDPGDYDVTITDANACEVIVPFTIEELVQFSVVETITDVDCFGDATGAIDLLVNDATDPVTILWTGAGVEPSDLNQTGLEAGAYTVEITDALGCFFTAEYTVNPGAEIVIDETLTQPSCLGAPLGEITIVLSGGAEPYLIDWPEAGETDVLTISDLAAGDYTVQVIDLNDCEATETYTIEALGEITVTSSTTNVTCNGDDNGTISIEAEGQTEPLTVVWTPDLGTDLNQVDLPAGSYTLELTDADGCTFIETYEVTSPELLEVNETLIQPSCDIPLGEISLEINGGVEPYSIVWAEVPADDQLTISNLPNGTYSVTVTDANDCEFTNTYEIIDYVPIEIIETITQPECGVTETGDITISINGGSEPFSINWPELALTDVLTVTDLDPGTYTVEVTDVNLCESIETYSIIQANTLEVTSTIENVSCSGFDDGEILLEVTGQQDPITVIWFPDIGDSLNETDLAPGSYSVEITDANGCIRFDTYEITAPNLLEVTETITQPECANPLGEISLEIIGGVEPYSITWQEVSADNETTVSDLTAGTYNVAITDVNGCEFFGTYTLVEPVVDIEITGDVIQPGCSGATTGEITIEIANGTEPYSINWPELGETDVLTVSDVLPGTYTVVVTDAELCVSEETFTVTEPGILDVVVTLVNLTCAGNNDGEINLEVTGQVDPLTVVWTPDLGTDLNQTGLAAGTYAVALEDAEGCVYEESFVLTEPDALQATETIIQPSCEITTGEISLEITGGTQPYAIGWPEVGVTDETTVSGLEPGVYNLIVVDANDCVFTAEYEVVFTSDIIVTETIVQPGCTGATVGEITIAIEGGDEPYSISWPELGLTDVLTVSDLDPGTYMVQVSDVNDCLTEETYVITEPGILDVAAEIEEISCSGFNDASIALTVTGQVDPLTVVWTPDLGTDLTQTGLAPGDYTVEITDAEGCSFTETYTIDPKEPLQAAATVTQPACLSPSGEITIEITGGTEPIEFQWVGAGIDQQFETTITDLDAGTYSLIIVDVNDCIFTEDYTIEPLLDIEITEDITQPGCTGATTGEITIALANGAEPYSITWPELGLTDVLTVTDLLPGEYTVEVEDADNCSATETYTITAPGVLDVLEEVINSNCAGDNSGSISLTVSGQVDPLTVVWTPDLGTDLIQTDLAPGSYSVEITDADGCSFANSYEITEAETLVVTETVSETLACGDDLGTISIEIAGGTEPYEIEWLEIDAPDQTVLENLAAGTYTVEVTDVNGCSVIEAYEITAPETIVITETLTQPLCFGELGSIETVITGGTEPYTISWTGSGSDQANLENLTSGNYTITVTDANDCTLFETYTINETFEIETTLTLVQPECFFLVGSAEVAITGGNAPYSIDWAVPGTEDQTLIEDLTPGAYTVTITDANDCFITEEFTIEEPFSIEVTEVITDVRCNGDNTGAIDLEITNTIGDYTVSWTGPNGFTSPIEDISNLFEGDYTVTVNDDFGCSFEETYTVGTPEELTITVDQVVDETCLNEEDGAITVTITGGTPDYIISWTSGAFTSSETVLADLAAGDYTLTVEDANGCETETTVTIESGSEISALITSVDSTCGNEDGSAEAEITSGNEVATISWVDSDGLEIGTDALVENLSSGIYTLTVTDVTGCSFTDDVSISDSDATVIDADITEISCIGEADAAILITLTNGTAPYLLEWTADVVIADDEYNPQNLPAGQYTATVTDAEGCISNEIIDITAPEEILITETITNVSCNGLADGTISLEISGGTGEYTVNWIDPVSIELELSGLNTGEYTVEVADANNCNATETYTITEEPLLEVTVDFSEILCADEAGTIIDVTATGGVTPYTFEWTGDVTSQLEDLTDIGPGTYTITVTDDAGCVVSEEITITQVEEITIEVVVSEPACSLDNGEISATVEGGTGTGYEFFWYDTSDAPVLISQEQLVTGLAAGTYMVEVFDDAGCSAMADINLSNNTGEITAEVINIACAFEPTGEIDITVSGLSDPLNYSWNGPEDFTSTDEDLLGLEPGDYNIEVTDADGCVLLETYSVSASDELNVTIDANSVCFGDTDSGSIDISIAGGTEPYTVNWVELGSDALNLTGLSPGCYNLEVSDVNGCSFSSEVCIGELEELVLATTVTGNICFTDLNGQIDLAISGGEPEYTVDWTNAVGTFTSDELSITELATGEYTAVVTDNSGCESTTSATINSNPEIIAELDITPITCPGDENAALEITISGGVGLTNLEWTGPDGFTSTETSLTNLDDGTYCYTVTDAIGCSIEECINLFDPMALSAEAVVDSVSCFGSASGSIDLEITGGYSPYATAWEYESNPFSNDEDLTDLELGEYTVNITDSMGCETTASFEIFGPTELSVEVDNLTGSSCPTSTDGSIEITVDGGSPSYTFDWSLGGESVSADEDPTDLASGEYELLITDNNGCELELSSVILTPLGNANVVVPETAQWCFTEEPQLILALESDAVSVEWLDENAEVLSTTDSLFIAPAPGVYNYVFTGTDGPCTTTDTVEVTVWGLPVVDAGEDVVVAKETTIEIGGSPTTDSENTVVWSNPDLLNDNTLFNPEYVVINELQQFLVTATSPEGCVATDSVTIETIPEVVINSGFTPNGDGINDFWVLGNYEIYPSIEVNVYNRWGEPIFYSAGYNDPWDGTFEGKKLPIGTYYYVITINEPDLKTDFNGPVTILR